MAEETTEKRISQIGAKVDALFERIGKLTRLHRLIICLVTFLVIGGSYYYFVFIPKNKVLSAARTELKSQEDKLVSFKKKARSLAKYEKKMAEIQEKFDIAMQELPDKKELPSLLTGVSKAGTKAGLEFLLFQPAPVVNREFYKEIPLSMTVEGSYHQVADFFFQVSGLNRIVNIQNMSMAVAGKTPGKVQMKCSAVTYMFADPGEAKGKKGKRKKGKK